MSTQKGIDPQWNIGAVSSPEKPPDFPAQDRTDRPFINPQLDTTLTRPKDLRQMNETFRKCCEEWDRQAAAQPEQPLKSMPEPEKPETEVEPTKAWTTKLHNASKSFLRKIFGPTKKDLQATIARRDDAIKKLKTMLMESERELRRAEACGYCRRPDPETKNPLPRDGRASLGKAWSAYCKEIDGATK